MKSRKAVTNLTLFQFGRRLMVVVGGLVILALPLWAAESGIATGAPSWARCLNLIVFDLIDLLSSAFKNTGTTTDRPLAEFDQVNRALLQKGFISQVITKYKSRYQ